MEGSWHAVQLSPTWLAGWPVAYGICPVTLLLKLLFAVCGLAFVRRREQTKISGKMLLGLGGNKGGGGGGAKGPGPGRLGFGLVGNQGGGWGQGPGRTRFGFRPFRPGLEGTGMVGGGGGWGKVHSP